MWVAGGYASRQEMLTNAKNGTLDKSRLAAITKSLQKALIKIQYGNLFDSSAGEESNNYEVAAYNTPMAS
jgi:hypothetical protein